MPILANFPGGGGSGDGLALAAVSNITTQVASEKAYIKWTDPDDIYFEELPLATWAGTLLVRKAGSMPTGRYDGTVVIDSKNRNQYTDSYFCDGGLANNETYYYKFFPYTTTDTYTDSADNEFIVTPSAQVSGIDTWSVTNMSASTEAGDGKMTVAWTDPDAEIVADGITLATWAGTTVIIKSGGYADSKDDSDAAYILKSTVRNQYATTPLIVTGLKNGTQYYISFFPETTDGGINTDISQRTTGVANRITISAEPTQSNSLIYDGNVLSPTWDNYDETQMTLGGTTSGITAGSYVATFTPVADYRWGDGSIGTKDIIWSIGKITGSLSLSTTAVAFNLNTLSATVNVSYVGDGTIVAESDNTGVATVSISGTTLTISSVNYTSGDANIVVSIIDSVNYTVPESQTISVVADLLPAIGGQLNDYSWEDISKIAMVGQGPNYFQVGDCKSVLVNGTVGTLSINTTYYTYIIGFDHNGATNTIDFGTFKSELSNGTDICLTDNYYSTSISSSDIGQKRFNMNHGAPVDEGSAGSHIIPTAGCWRGSDARYDILGSTDIAPSGYTDHNFDSRQGYDASSACATNPVANTLMAALPEDLRAVMKPMVTYAQNGVSSADAGNIVASVDYLPLLAEYEILGSTSKADAEEKNHQAQYAYYAAGNSKLKHNHAGDAAIYWLRSVGKAVFSAYGFCYITAAGKSVATTSSDKSYGLSPIFRV